MRLTALRIGLVLAIGAAGCEDASIPAAGSPAWEEAVAAFYTGVAAIQTGADERAAEALSRFVELAPGEPAGLANQALLEFQQRRLDEAAALAERALRQVPSNTRIRMLAALIDRARGRLDDAIEQLRRVAPGDDDSARASFLLVQFLEERGGPADAGESRAILDALVSADPTSDYLAITSARHAARHADQAALGRALDRLASLSSSWSEADRLALEQVRAASAPADAGIELAALAASLEALPRYGRQRDALYISDQQPDLVSTDLIRLAAPSARPALPDTAIQFATSTIGGSLQGLQDVRSIPADESGQRTVLLGADAILSIGEGDTPQRLALPGGGGADAALAVLDLDHDFRMDLAVAGAGGLRLFRQEASGAFLAMPQSAIPATTRARTIDRVWPADTDLDGDVDLVIGASSAAPFILSNRGDGTFEELARFDNAVGALDFAWGDLDDDGVPDAAFVDAAGRVHVFMNPRQDRPTFIHSQISDGPAVVRAIGLGDMDADGRFDLVLLGDDGTLAVSSPVAAGWQTREVGRDPDLVAGASPARLFLADLDNNGALDVLASSATTRIWLADTTYAPVPFATLPVRVTAATDPTGAGRIELLGVDEDLNAVRVTTRPSVDYFGLTLIARATDQPGDRRINTYGIGGQAEVRSGLLYQKRAITDPVVHFGIGPNTGVTVARILWPNGTAQAEFDLLASQGRPIIAEQRLKGSCPWLFTFDGDSLQFVTDLAWRTALGLRINAYGSSSVIHSEDRVRIRGDQLVPRDGFYDLRITAELWESHFFDHVSLMVIDHPANTDVFVDESFALPPPDTALQLTAPLAPIASAIDQRERDVTALVAAADERYIDTFELGPYQGVAASEYFVEIDLGPDAPSDQPLLLVAFGWVQPTDGSINLALGQGGVIPRALRAEVPDGHGGWRVLHPDLGMPAGKTKTVLIDLEGAFSHDGPRKVRLLTTMEIYWDRIAWTTKDRTGAMHVTRLTAETADLQFRGFSRVRRESRRAPELPEYEVISGTAPLWAGLEGLHTRFGDVRPLLESVDDRYAIITQGDEMLLRFRAPPAPPEGTVRDFVLVSDAWVKDGDFNNGFSSSLQPLPYHGLTDYSVAPGRLADEHAFQLHPADWRDYHTRYLSASRFRHALSGN